MWDLSNLYTTGEITLRLTGDYNGDETVDQADLDLVLLNWGHDLRDPTGAGWANDLPTRTIDQAELDKVLLNWGANAQLSTSSGVPEPRSALLVVLLSALATLRLKWKILNPVQPLIRI